MSRCKKVSKMSPGVNHDLDLVKNVCGSKSFMFRQDLKIGVWFSGGVTLVPLLFPTLNGKRGYFHPSPLTVGTFLSLSVLLGPHHV